MSSQRGAAAVIFASPPPPPPWSAPRRRRTCKPAAARPVAPVTFGRGEDISGKGERTTAFGFLPGPLYAAQAALRRSTTPSRLTVPEAVSSLTKGFEHTPRASTSSKPLSFPSLTPPKAHVTPASPIKPKATRRPWTRPERQPRPPPAAAWALDPSHRLPTLWGLYRDLLRLGTPPEYAELGRFVREQFRAERGKMDEAAAADDLRRGYKLLEELQTQSGIDRVVGRLHAYYGKQAERLALSMPFRQRHTGGRIPWGHDKYGLKTGQIFQASKFNPPMPMMKPQPHNVSMMMYRRREACIKAADMLEVARKAREAPAGSALKSLLANPDFKTRLNRARRVLSAADARMRLSPSPELVVSLLPFAVRRERWAEEKRAMGEGFRSFGMKDARVKGQFGKGYGEGARKDDVPHM